MPDNAEKWGMRVESSLIVRRVLMKRAFGGDICLGFERLTCVPIQTRMVSKIILSREEIQWMKVHLLTEFCSAWRSGIS
jgi:Xaa-Pro aminopeptidase